MFGRIIRLCLRILYPFPIYEVGTMAELADMVTETVINHPDLFSSL